MKRFRFGGCSLLLWTIFVVSEINLVLGVPVYEEKGWFKTISPLPRDEYKSGDSKRPTIRHPGVFKKNHDRNKVAKDIKAWRPDDGTNIWELSGLYQGDIMSYENDIVRHGVLNDSLRWNYGIVPYHIVKDDFTEEEIETINEGINELREKTCLIFRPKRNTDTDYVVVQGSESGCWSFVGRRGESQVLNLMTPGCVKHGVVVHEFIHAIGFYHQQSSHDRDDYVTIIWDNILEDHKHNFNKYDNDTVTNYNVGYDYNSVMHYGPKAFAIDKTSDTIIPKDETATIGQRIGLSDKDAAKIKIMYKSECQARALRNYV